MKYLKNIDMFGAPLIFNIDKTTKYHQTKCGGISTFIVYSLVLIYAIVNLKTWAVGDLLPTITTQRETIYAQHVPELAQLEVQITLVSYNSSAPYPTIDRQFFSIQYGINIDIYPTSNIFPQMTSNNTYQFALDFNPQNLQGSSFYVLSCNPDKVTRGKCVDIDTVAQYLNQNAYYFQMKFNLTYVNPSNFEVSIVQQIDYISVEQGLTHFSTINLGATLYQMQKPAIIQSDEYQYGFTSQTQNSETLKEKYGQQSYSYNDPIYGSLYVNSIFYIDFVADLVLIQYPSIFTVLGNIGAIGGLLLYFKHVVFFYNTREAEKLMIDDVIKRLYPKYKEIKIDKKYNVIKSVSLQDKTIDINHFKLFEQIMRTKIYEQFSLPQIIVNQIQFHQFMKELHPNYQYGGDEFASLIQVKDDSPAIQQDLENKDVDSTILRYVDQEPQPQSLR